MHTYTHMHTHARPRMHTHIHAHTHTHAQKERWLRTVIEDTEEESGTCTYILDTISGEWKSVFTLH